MSWNYRVCKSVDKDGSIYFCVREVYYHPDGAVKAMSSREIIVGDDVGELKRVMIQLLDAFDKPVLGEAEIQHS